ncbi:acyl-coenzyme A thioesterase PaaI-like protein [Gordonia amarae]|uniref:Acyl-coenzyme A thioesterase THEM4 n=2 Tax=Gordonia amarae TaxID=36821 RepID=G7GQX8_9ACTN|nr:PaaI family thioesterase [Gordonia amarae]MCS3877578.1 acyl-coenzyme A thioesterase PaaI-like protein [Gordonia amarae]GAB06003.1 hypothetical protein GOAMR_46_01010 [Gordonia amarae NBRC 15530]
MGVNTFYYGEGMNEADFIATTEDERAAASTATASDDNSHRGGFRPIDPAVGDRGGPRYGEFIEQVRLFMDNVRLACPTPEMGDDLIDTLKDLNAKLASVQIDEWHTPAGTRIDLPARGNITLPPFTVDNVDKDAGAVDMTVTFTNYHLGGNNAAHGGQVAVAFDDIGGYASAVATNGICRTGYLKVDYRSVTPLNTPLKVRAWADRVDGRKAFIKGTMHDGDRLCAELDGLFIRLNPGQP